MDDLTSKIENILGSEEGQAQIRELAAMLGGENGEMPDLSALGNMFGGAQNGESSHEQSADDDSILGDIDVGMLLKMKDMFTSSKGSDKNSQLLLALRPHLKDENKEKVDGAIKIMKLIALLPLIKDSGLFGGELF